MEMVVFPMEPSSFFHRLVMGLMSFGRPAGTTSTMGTSVATLFATEEALFTGCDVATDSAGTSIGDFRWPLGGVDVFRVNRTTLFFFPMLFIGSLGAAHLVTLRLAGLQQRPLPLPVSVFVCPPL